MYKKLMFGIMAIAAMTVLNSCSQDDLEKVYDENTSLDSPFIFSEGYQDSIIVAYDLPTPATDWLSMVKDETKVCKLSIPGTHDTMTGMGFYQPVLKFIFNMTAISQVSTLGEQMASGLRFFDIRPVVSTDTIAKKKILRLTHGISELDITFEWTIDQLQSYLKAHPTEFFIVKLQFDNGFEDQKDLYTLLSNVLHMSKYQGLFVENWRPDITVAEMRGKILWLSRFDLRPFNAVFHYPIVYCDWPDEDPDIDEELNPEAQRNCAMYSMEDETVMAKLYKQDYYKTTTEKRMKNKQKTVIDMMHTAREATASDENIWIVNHCSAYTEVSPRGYITNASNLHPLVVDDLQKYEGTVGIIPMDMACHDYVHCIINGGSPYTSDYLYGFHPLSLSVTNLLIKSNKLHFK
ncbi:hypothetical protein [Xylanibacter ruminicola]|uniref:Phosphatidylinositol diacylglycerol-lyase n=1 Tax=Xylanibacter ruminicola TaxID=839 RepID=A0A1M6Y462_XYLRU|nr:hypothetical protein [Xylanibacter ruminicola]SHL13081.1 hypothetical protein SAMN05216463_12417 [Xylanibacter ruminicola]